MKVFLKELVKMHNAKHVKKKRYLKNLDMIRVYDKFRCRICYVSPMTMFNDKLKRYQRVS